jgi:acylphosphatase
VRVVVSGTVQGVFFRDTVRGAAVERGVAGWVRNRSDGTVEAELEGPPEAVHAVVEVCRRGPAGAEVAGVDVEEGEAQGERGFEVR